MSVRRVSNRGGNIIGSFPSLKNGQPVPYESTIERDLLYFLEYDRTVRRYTMQPFVIAGVDAAGKPHTYTPDALVERIKGRTLVECKPAALQDDPHTQQQITLGQQWADANGCDFVLVTDADLRTGHRLANLKLLWRYARQPVPHAVTERCIGALAADRMLWSDLTAALAGIAPPLTIAPFIYALLFQHVLTADLDLPLSASTMLRLAVVTVS
jgi:hypothetical protein